MNEWLTDEEVEAMNKILAICKEYKITLQANLYSSEEKNGVFASFHPDFGWTAHPFTNNLKKIRENEV